MSFKRGPQYRFFVTLENPLGAIDGNTATLSVITASASLSSYGPNGGVGLQGIGKLGSVTGSATDSSNSIHEIKNVSAIDPAPGNIDAPFDIFGQTRPMDNPIRKDWKVTVTRKAEDKLFFKLFAQGRFGATGSTPGLFDGLSAYPDTTGYRLYISDGTDWDVYYHGSLDPTGYKMTLAPTGVTEEQLIFSGGLWKPGVATGSADLTSSQSIVQA
jgi:hypothetical protein